MGLQATSPIDPVDVCAHFEIRLICLSDLNSDCPLLRNTSDFSAVTVPCGHKTAIVHNDTHHPHRQRSNICHELAHCFLGHQCTPPLREDGARNHNGGIEAEANFLSGCLLMPNEAAIHIVQNGLALQAQSIYGISSAMLTYRLRISGANRIHERRMRQARTASSGR
jgi:Zn-dependent peptidase ImmA (M78 family)